MRLRALAGGVASCVLLAACSSGDSILVAGNEPATVPAPTAPPATAAPGETLAPTTTRPAATTTTTPLASLPPCPVDALDVASGPVEVTFWHGLGGESEDALIALTEAYHASQERVRIRLENQGGYKQTIDKYTQSSQAGRPDMVMLPEYMVQQAADSATFVPIQACFEESDFDTAPFLPKALRTFETEGVQWSMPFNVSNPVLYFLKPVFEAAGLDPADPPVSLEDLRTAAQAIVDSGAASTGHRPRLRRRLRRRLVHRAVVRPDAGAVRRQRQRPAGAGDAGALRRRGRRRADDRGAVADHRRAGRDGR